MKGGLFILLFLYSISVYSQSKVLRDNKKLQYEMSHEYWKKNQPKFRIENAKFAVKQSKSNSAEKNKQTKLNDKITEIRKRIKK
jgi:hypothetical protein